MLDQTYLYCRIISIMIPGRLFEKLLSSKDVIFQAVTKQHLSFQGNNCTFFFTIVMNTLVVVWNSILSAGNKHKNGGFRTEKRKLNITFMQCKEESYRKALGPWLNNKTGLSPIKIMIRKSSRLVCFRLRRQKMQQYRQQKTPMSHIIDQPNVLVTQPEVVTTTSHEPVALDYCPQSMQDSTSPYKGAPCPQEVYFIQSKSAAKYSQTYIPQRFWS